MTGTRPVLGFAAFSGTGKTTLLEKLLPLLVMRGIRVGMIKHAHHDFDIDTPGKDSYRLRKAGARQMLIASSKRRALMTEMSGQREPQLEELVNSLNLDSIDLILVEGFKHLSFPKIELHRAALGHPLLFRKDRNIIALAADHAPDCRDLPLLDINDPNTIADFVIAWLKRVQ